MSTATANFWAHLKGALFRVFPHHPVSRATFWLARRETRLKNRLVRLYIRAFRVDMSEAHEPDPDRYASFNAFFVRALRPEARPIANGSNDIASPADGRISQLGELRGDTLVQAKGQSYGLGRLLGGSPERAAPFVGGRFCTIYLSPRDYHRVHMPVSGRLREMVHVPGRLFSVAEYATRAIPGLFTRNERMVAIFEGSFGPFAVVMVGAVNVAAIETAWAGLVTPPRGKRVRGWDYRHHAPPLILERGAELGRFNLGSTAIVVFPPETVRWPCELRAGSPIRMGARLGELLPRASGAWPGESEDLRELTGA